MTYFGLLDINWWQALLALLLLTHVTIISVTVYLHRCQAHRAVTLHPAVAHFFRFWLWLTTGMVTREWVAIHRRHHASCETPDDPHSPQVLGLDTVLWRGAELYQAAAEDHDRVARFAQGTPDDWIERHLYRRHHYLGIGLMLLLDLLLFGVWGITIWALQMIWIPFWAAGVINGIGHYWGYRNFDSPDASTNIVPWGLLIGGEELHNNHHAYPSSARLSSKWWEFDLGWFWIRLFDLLGLARINRCAPQIRVIPDKTAIDVETVRAVITSRMLVLSSYARQVLKPVSKAELCTSAESCRKLYRRTRRLLLRDESRLDEAARQLLGEVLAQSQKLQTVYQFRERLAELWGRGSASQEQLAGALQDWCRQAEASGIEALQQFAARLRGYSLKPM